MIVDSQFTAGARVAIFSGREHTRVSEATILKVYKNGNFILEGDKLRRQWRPNRNGSTARRVGRSAWDFEHMELWSPETSKKVREIKEREARSRRLSAITRAFERLHYKTVTDRQLDALEDALGLANGAVSPCR